MSLQKNRWRNWAGNLLAYPKNIFTPDSVEELQDRIKKNPNREIRVVGTGHSWSPLVNTSDILINPKNITKANGEKVWMEKIGNEDVITFFPSASWLEVREVLEKANKFLPATGGYPYINAIGFLATGGHGTGWHYPTVPDFVYAMEIVDSKGNINHFSENKTPNDMEAIRVNLGVLGVITKVSLKVVPMFNLKNEDIFSETKKIIGINPLENKGVVDDSILRELVTANDYIELYWFPFSSRHLGKTFSDANGMFRDDGQIWIKKYNLTNESETEGVDRILKKRKIDDIQSSFAAELMDKMAENPTNPYVVPSSGHLVWASLVKNIIGGKIRDDITSYVDDIGENIVVDSIENPKPFVAKAPPLFYYGERRGDKIDIPYVMDLEIAIPIPKQDGEWDFSNIVRAWYQVVNYVHKKASKGVYPLTCCIHARFTGNSQSLLSPVYEEKNSDTRYCWLEIWTAYSKEDEADERKKDLMPFEDMVKEIGPAWIEMGGRPHWGKYWQSIPNINTLIKSCFPKANVNKFNELRKKLDPDEKFLNPFLENIKLFN